MTVKKTSVVLTFDQAIEAVCADLRQYDPQIVLIGGLLQLISGGSIAVKSDLAKNGAWISQPGQRRMRWIAGPELVEEACRLLVDAELEPEVLAAVCTRVFHSRSVVDTDPATGRQGLRIDTGIETYRCRQCGRCCRALAYHDAVTAEDVACWKKLQRNDILAWVGVYKRNNRTAYRIWQKPGTRRLAEICPFLKYDSPRNRWLCRIHDVKPAICRQYPVSRKHARMTRCPGVDRPTGAKSG